MDNLSELIEAIFPKHGKTCAMTVSAEVIMFNLEPKDASQMGSPAPSRTEFLSAKRTAITARNSLLSLTTTGLSLIGIGFTIYSALTSIPSGMLERNPAEVAVEVGLFLDGIGTVLILYAAAVYWDTIRELHQDYGVRLRKTPMIFSLLIASLGVVSFFIVAIRIR